MATFRLFAWNTGNTIPDEDQIGDLAITTLSPRSRRYDNNYGGVKWFGGPDEDLGYCIGLPNPPKYRPRFKRSSFTEQAYLDMVNDLSYDEGGPVLWGTLEAKNWVDAQEYWQTYTGGTAASPSPTPSNNTTPTPTPTLTPSPTPSAQRLAFDVDPTSFYSTPQAACEASHNFLQTAYLEVGYSEPTVGAYWYTTVGGSTEYSPGACTGPSYYVFRRSGVLYAVQTGNNTPSGGCDNTGEIIAAYNCSSLPSVTPTATPTVTPTVTPTTTPSPSITVSPTPSTSSGGGVSGAVACWNMNESSGNLVDSVGSNDLTTQTLLSYSQSGKVGNSIGFLSNTSKAQGGTGLAYLTDFTVSFWAKRNTATTSSIRFVFENRAYGTGSDGGFRLYYDTNADLLTCGIWDGFSVGVHPLDSDISDGNWHHVVVTHDTSNALPTTGYTDNVADVSSATFKNVAATGGDGRPVIVGQNSQFSSYSFEGYLDVVQVWDRALTASEVSTLWNSGSGLACGPAPTPSRTPTVTPTISVTPTPSTSSASDTTIFIDNDDSGGPTNYTITNVTVGGVSPSGASFPVISGNNTSGTISTSGDKTVVVTLSGSLDGTESLSVITTAYNDCRETGTTPYTFSLVPIYGNTVNVTYSSGLECVD